MKWNKEIPKKLIVRIEGAIRTTCKEHKISVKARTRILNELKRDLILPGLGLKANAKIEVEYYKEDHIRDPLVGLSVQIGPRDFDFNAKTGSCDGAGTLL